MTPPILPTDIAGDFDYAIALDVCARARRQDADRWLWHGYLAAGNVSLLVGQWKAGKTTLLSVLLARLGTGGPLAGLAVRPARAVVISEEADDLWADRIERLGIGDQLQLVSRPFRGRPTPDQWHRLIASLVARHRSHRFDLVVMDPLAAFLPGRTENDAGTMLDVLMPLQALTRLGVCVLVLHHPRKGPTIAGQAARGTGALSGSVDILLELDLMGGAADDDRRRRLSSFSRHRTTPRRLVIELTADGTDYVSLGDFVSHDFDDNWAVLSGVLEDAPEKLTRAAILKAWPADFAKPSPMALWRWLDRAVKEGRVLHEATGRRADPFRYWLDGMDEVWASDPWARPELPPLDPTRFGPQKTLAEVLAERGKGRGR
jgi:AAA domain